jgi:cardiolipin synthase
MPFQASVFLSTTCLPGRLPQNRREEYRILTRLLIQPNDGLEPLLTALRSARRSLDILIFRFDRSEVEQELVAAVTRGVAVHALIAFTNRGEEKNLRKLEGRLLEHGITVRRTDDDLVRYHGKMFIVDRKMLYLLAFNFTFLDIHLSRSFAMILDDAKIVAEALKLFEADANRQPYTAGCDQLIVSPANARKQLTAFINGAEKQLLLYELKLSDHEFVNLLNRKIADGVEVRILGRSSSRSSLPTRTLSRRLHARAIFRDRKSVFLGSQSLRRLEMDARREIGVILHDAKIARQMVEIFEEDWRCSLPSQASVAGAMFDVPANKVAKLVARHVNFKTVVLQVLERVLDTHSDVPFEPDEVSRSMHEAFREEVHDAVVSAMRELVAGTLMSHTTIGGNQPETLRPST